MVLYCRTLKNHQIWQKFGQKNEEKLGSTCTFNRPSQRNTTLGGNGGSAFGVGLWAIGVHFGPSQWPWGQKIIFSLCSLRNGLTYFHKGENEASKNGTFEAVIISILFYFLRPMKMWKKRYYQLLASIHGWGWSSLGKKNRPQTRGQKKWVRLNYRNHFMKKINSWHLNFHRKKCRPR